MRTNDGKEIRSTKPEEIVAELHAMSWQQEKTDRDFMRESAGRILVQTGRKVRHDEAAAFVDDLIELGFLSEVN